MKDDAPEVKIVPIDHDHVRIYRPVETARCRDAQDNWTEVEHNDPAFVYRIEENVEQDVLQRYDALHYWFSEACDGDIAECEEAETPSARMGAALAENIMVNDPIVLSMGRVPDWKDIRDRATIMTGHGISEQKELVHFFRNHHHGNAVYIDVDDIHTRTDRSIYSTIYMLLDVEKQAKKIIEDKLCEEFTVREALTFMSSSPDDIIEHTLWGERVKSRKWFIESKWITDYVIEKFPQFQTNFRTLVITGAFRRFMNDDYSINRLYRVLAMMGRVNTKVVFIG